MLTQLNILNFIIIDQLTLDFKKGLSVITGETGAGKSILIDALTLVLGGRADSNLVGPFGDKCDLTVCFDLDTIPTARQWLQEHDFSTDSSEECIIRRILLRDGKSRQMINGYSVTLAQLKDFLPLIINIHSQNQQQLLTKASYQRELLDSFCNQPKDLEQVKNCYHLYTNNQKAMLSLKQLQQNSEVQQELLLYQLEEFNKLALLPGEYDQLDKEHKQLANADQLITDCQTVLSQIADQEERNAADLLYQAQHTLSTLQQYDDKLSIASEMINHSIIHLEEAKNELRAFTQQIEVNPNRLTWVETRLSKIHDLARKYQTTPQQLYEVQLNLQQQFQELKEACNQYDQLFEKDQELMKNYQIVAKSLSQHRKQTAKLLSDQITQQIHQLGMPGGTFKVEVEETNEITAYGSDHIEFVVATNPGQSQQPLSKVASGGEISRIALAIYVATAEKKTTPILVFDEADVGIGGGTAAIVGRLLKSLSNNAQVLCITHLPQVAAFGDHHYQVQKDIKSKQTKSSIVALSEEERIAEIARMLGGLTITEKTLAHARELIDIN